MIHAPTSAAATTKGRTGTCPLPSLPSSHGRSFAAVVSIPTSSSTAYPAPVRETPPSRPLTRRELVVRAAALSAAFALPALRFEPEARARGRSRPAGPGTGEDAARAGDHTRGDRRTSARGSSSTVLYDGVHPLAIAQPLDAADVSAVVRWARTTGVHIVARSGGHSYGGYSTTTGRRRRSLEARGRARQRRDRRPSAQAHDSGTSTTRSPQHGLAIPAGTCPSVGIGGHALGGGFGLASRAWGLASDNLRSLQIVTADGRILTADSTHHSDLFWACRGGGGGNFGIVTRLVFRTHAVSQGSYFIATWPWTQVEEVLASFLQWAPTAPDALGSLCRLATGPGGPTLQVFGQFLGSETRLKTALATLGPPAQQLVTGTRVVARSRAPLGRLPRTHAPVVLGAGAPGVRRRLRLHRAAFRPRRSLAAFRHVIESRGTAPGALLIDAYGGALNRVPRRRRRPSRTATRSRRSSTSRPATPRRLVRG